MEGDISNKLSSLMAMIRYREDRQREHDFHDIAMIIATSKKVDELGLMLRVAPDGFVIRKNLSDDNMCKVKTGSELAAFIEGYIAGVQVKNG